MHGDTATTNWYFYRRHYELISKFNGLKTLLREGLSEPEFYSESNQVKTSGFDRVDLQKGIKTMVHFIWPVMTESFFFFTSNKSIHWKLNAGLHLRHLVLGIRVAFL